MNLKLGYVIVYVEYIEKTKHFYETLLGLELKNEFGTYIEFNTGNTILSFNTREGAREVTGLPIPDGIKKEQTFELGFVTDEVEAVSERLRGEGVQVLEEPKVQPWGQKVAYVEDPDGHYIELKEMNNRMIVPEFLKEGLSNLPQYPKHIVVKSLFEQ